MMQCSSDLMIYCSEVTTVLRSRSEVTHAYICLHAYGLQLTCLHAYGLLVLRSHSEVTPVSAPESLRSRSEVAPVLQCFEVTPVLQSRSIQCSGVAPMLRSRSEVALVLRSRSEVAPVLRSRSEVAPVLQCSSALKTLQCSSAPINGEVSLNILI